MNKTEIRDEWEKRIAAYKSSGLSASAWCAANNLKTAQLWYWLRKFKTTKDKNIIDFLLPWSDTLPDNCRVLSQE